MAFILSQNRNRNIESAFDAYAKYLESVKTRFPPSAYQLATSAWYFNPDDHKCPHDAWLEEMIISEPAEGKRHEVRKVSIRIKLLNAYHDGYIEFLYPLVFSYQLNSLAIEAGHQDWLYDEFRLSDTERLCHEIEWSSNKGTNLWIIEADDVHFNWTMR